MTIAPPLFGDADLRQLAERGIPPSEAERQIALLRSPPARLRLLRPCTLHDGIEVVAQDRLEHLHTLHESAAREGRLGKFVPASGAASRMFQDLTAFRGRGASRTEIERRARRGDRAAGGMLLFLENLERFPFWEELRHELGDRPHEPDAILEALLSEDGLGYGSLPKGLIPFHRYDDESRTAFEEHLVEAAKTIRDARGTCRLHVTVSPEHRETFESVLERNRPAYESSFGVRFVVTFSVQDPATDMLALDEAGLPFRLPDGTLLFRPGGHGSLLRNLGACGGDLVSVKNIDNVTTDRRRATTYVWKRALTGRLVELQRRATDLLRTVRSGLAAPSVLDEALAFCRDVLHVTPSRDVEARRFLLETLDRPMRVCAVVRNTGEPGGGPFWVEDRDGGTSVQIVEGAQLDPDDRGQQELYASSTYFNPTDLLCALRDDRGETFDLSRFTDPDAVIFARKTHDGRALLALERPGLWNGGMARWNTVFVEVPLETFTPVKSVNDLLRPEHQP